MTYNPRTKIPEKLEQAERQMLTEGRNYTEIAAALGVRALSVAARNQNVYRIPLQPAFLLRLERDGLPSRRQAPPNFCLWFTGLFDGEGCLAAHTRAQRGGLDKQLAIKITLRDDDLSVLKYVHENLKVGSIHERPARTETSNPSATFTVQKIKDLAEVIVPLFDAYALRTKKGREYPVWRAMVIGQYAATLGGHTRRFRPKIGYDDRFIADMMVLRTIRTYSGKPAA